MIRQKTVSLSQKNLLDTYTLPKKDIITILNTAKYMTEISEREIKKVPRLRGKTIINMFFEPSTRTRTSFEIAGKRLSADVINISGTSSSLSKGESLKDTVLNLQAMKPDLIVVRHSASGAAHYVSSIINSPIINAGDGFHEHPTQALLDLFTIMNKKKEIKNLNITMVGDIAHSRVVRSNINIMKKMGMNITLCGPRTLIPMDIEKMEVKVLTNLPEAIKGADIIMMLRLQKERQTGTFFPSIREYSKMYGLSMDKLKNTNPDLIIMHPGPINRGIEISSEVADSPFSVIVDQVTNGVALRMALLHLLTRTNEHNERVQ